MKNLNDERSDGLHESGQNLRRFQITKPLSMYRCTLPILCDMLRRDSIPPISFDVFRRLFFFRHTPD
jgi:hypothetical protein